ncbi:replication factor C subunit 1-like isoform X1 [Watersipora subatra]|uniref:replication factor C subunit 1-like isoform X1 n=1 Tax=Watersipora subatra TaxID=2589382 RepID=UPI00355C2A81
MDIRKYLTSSSHNTRKQGSTLASQESETSTPKKKKSTSIKGNSKKSDKRKRVSYISDSSDEDVTVVEETPKKKSKSGTSSSGEPKVKKSDNGIKSSASDFFGEKKVTSGSKVPPKTIASALSEAVKTKKREDKKVKHKVNAKISKDEIIVLGSDEDWNDDESFAQLIDDKTEEHLDKDFNKTLDQLDRSKTTKSPQRGSSDSKMSNGKNVTPEKTELRLSKRILTKDKSAGDITSSVVVKTPSKKGKSSSQTSKGTPAKASSKSPEKASRKVKASITESQDQFLEKSPTKSPKIAPTKSSRSASQKSGKLSTKSPNKVFDKSLDNKSAKSEEVSEKSPEKKPAKSLGKTPTRPHDKIPTKSPRKTSSKYKSLPIVDGSDKRKVVSTKVPDDLSPESKSRSFQEQTPDSSIKTSKSDTPQKPPKVNLNGKTFVITGQLDNMDRDDAKEHICKLGGRVVSALSGKVNYLVAGQDAGVSKMAKAEKMSALKIINEAEFLELIGPSGDVSLADGMDSSMDIDEPAHTQLKDAASPGVKLQQPIKSSTKEADGLLPPPSLPRDQTSDLLWVDKYKPTSVSKIIGQMGDKSNARKLLVWLNNWHRHKKLGTKPVSSFGGFGRGDPTGAGFRAALLSGPPGIGKTTSAVLVCKEAGFSFFETNASDSRSKKILQGTIGQALGNTTLVDYMGNRGETNSKKHCIIMDEVDGMAGNEDRGGMQELIQLIKGSQIPVICICNDRQSSKIRSLANHCFDLRFQRPRVEQIKAAMKTVCFKEGITIDNSSLDNMIASSNHDVRQVLHNLSVWSASSKNLDRQQLKSDSDKAKKDYKIDAFTACRMAFSESETSKMSLKGKSDLFFYDYSIHPLFIQENYIHAVPHASKHNEGDKLKRLAKAAKFIAMGDVISKAIRTDKWGLLPMQAMFSSVLPAEALMGHLSKQIDFPRWLGKFSTTNKNARLNKDISQHMSLNVTANARHVLLDYLPILRDRLTRPLIKEEPSEGVKQVVGLLEEYDLLKDDYDSILELTQWPNRRDPRTHIESRTKAALTRQYNKSSHKLHYSMDAVPVKKRRVQASANDQEDEEVDSEGDSDEEVVKALKVPSKRSSAKTSSQKSNPSTNKEKKPRTSRGGKRK